MNTEQGVHDRGCGCVSCQRRQERLEWAAERAERLDAWYELAGEGR